LLDGYKKMPNIYGCEEERSKLIRLVCRHPTEWRDTPKKAELLKLNDDQKNQIKALSWWDQASSVKGLPEPQNVWHFHPAGFVGNLKDCCDCGEIYLQKIRCTRYRRTSTSYQYGPIYKGTKPLSTYSRWDELISSGKVTLSEKTILIGMSENEGNIDSIQSYDSEIMTAGAMQKTINPKGQGELPIQMNRFKELHPNLFQKYFKCCGWDVVKVSNKYTAYYKNKTGKDLKTIIRKGFTASSYGKKVESPASASFIEAIVSDEYQDLQVLDFIDRLNNKALKVTPTGYSNKISSFIVSNLGKATVLDHHINRPGYVASDFGNALNSFFASNPTVSKNPSSWGTNHSVYEKIIIDHYGVNRRGTDMSSRYAKMKAKL